MFATLCSKCAMSEPCDDQCDCLQLVPPGAVAKFKLVLNADKEQSFIEDLEYIVNGSQIFSLQLRAEIEPASLQLSAHELEFDFGEADSSQPWVQKVWHACGLTLCCSGRPIAQLRNLLLQLRDDLASRITPSKS